MSTQDTWVDAGWEHRGGAPTPAGAVTRPRTYGGWRKPTSPGLYGLGSLGTVVLFAGLIALIVIMRVFGLIPAVVLGIAFAVGLSTVLVRDRHGRSGLSRLTARASHTKAELSGANLYRSGPLSQVPGGRFTLPGLVAASELTEHLDATGRPFALLHHPHAEHVSVVLACEPDGAALVDPSQTDAWVAGWGAWLAGLGVEPDLVAASVTVATAPDPGTDLAAAVAADLHPNAPALAVDVLRELAEHAPAGQAATATWIALTFTSAEHLAPTRAGTLGALAELARLVTGRARRSRTRPVETVAADLAGRLPALGHALAATGAGSARPVAAGELCTLVAQAYRPDQPADLGDTTDWSDVGPAAAQADWDSYRHDGGTSITWAMTGAPRGAVHAGVLAPLLAPVADVPIKRVTLTYRPLDPAAAAGVVEADRRAASFRLGEGPRPAARVLAEHAAAEATAVEEAGGAGLVDFALLVTATVTDPARLPAARAAVHNAAAVARVQVLPCFGAQDAAFAATLPLGLHLPSHVAVPHAIRNTL